MTRSGATEQRREPARNRRAAGARRRGSGPGLLSPGWPLGFLLLVWAGERLIGERWWLTTWALYLPQPLFLLPSAAWMALALLLRRGRLLAGHAAVALISVGLLFSGAYRLPQPPARGDLRVMTWNVEGLLGDPEGVLATIRREAPDALLLQESSRAGGPDPVPWLMRRLPGWSVTHRSDVAIMSPHRLGPASYRPLGPARAGDRVALRSSLRVRGHTLELITVHYSTALPRPARERAWNHPRHNMQIAAAVRAVQTDNLLAVVRQTRRPLIVGGDFNSPPGTYADRMLGSRLQSAFAAGGSGFGWSFPSWLPLLRIDHLYASDDLRVLSCRTLPGRASDHLPLVADLAWR